MALSSDAPLVKVFPSNPFSIQQPETSLHIRNHITPWGEGLKTPQLLLEIKSKLNMTLKSPYLAQPIPPHLFSLPPLCQHSKSLVFSCLWSSVYAADYRTSLSSSPMHLAYSYSCWDEVAHPLKSLCRLPWVVKWPYIILSEHHILLPVYACFILHFSLLSLEISFVKVWFTYN